MQIAHNRADQRMHDLRHNARNDCAPDLPAVDLIVLQHRQNLRAVFVRSTHRPGCHPKRRNQFFGLVYTKCNICISYINY